MARVRAFVVIVGLLAGLTVGVASTPPAAAGDIGFGLSAALSGANEVGGGDPDGSGTAIVRVDPVTDEVCFDITVANVGTVTLAHIHQGNAGTNGSIVVDFDFPTNGLDGCVTGSAGIADSILSNPAGFYVNVHTSDFGGGAVRGQLGLTVTTVDDTVGGSEQLSLRDAVHTANADDVNSTIVLGLGRTYLLSMCGGDDSNAVGDLDHLDDNALTLEGNGSTVEQTCTENRVLHHLGAGDLDVQELTVTGGFITGGTVAHRGAGILATDPASFVELHQSAVFNNLTAAGGGGVAVAGTLLVEQSYVGGNSASQDGGGLYGNEVIVLDSTLHNNGAGDEGGAVLAADATIVRSTLIANAGGAGSHVAAGQLTSSGSIYTDELGAGDACGVGGTVTSNGYNFVDSAAPGACAFAGTGDVVGTTDPGLRPLFPARQQPTSAFIPEESPVVDAVPVSADDCEENDQRGLERPQGDGCDTGSIEQEVCSEVFSDISAAHPFCFEIGWMGATGVSTGTQPGPQYKPNPPVSRAAMSAFMYRLAGEPPFDPPGTPTFDDVSPAHPFFTEIEWMADEGITNGFGDGTYRPSTAVSRGAMSAFMYRLAESPPFVPPVSPTFDDVSLTHPFFTEIEWMASESITTGFGDGTYRPGAAVSRQAMAAFMYRLADGLLPGQDLN